MLNVFSSMLKISAASGLVRISATSFIETNIDSRFSSRDNECETWIGELLGIYPLFISVWHSSIMHSQSKTCGSIREDNASFVRSLRCYIMSFALVSLLHGFLYVQVSFRNVPVNCFHTKHVIRMWAARVKNRLGPLRRSVSSVIPTTWQKTQYFT